ncbi:MAG: hypothetical protein AAB131_12835, partial [Actinomycetota bacterium]
DDVLYGLQVANLAGTADSGNEYALYQAGTSWDFGLYVEDDARFTVANAAGGSANPIDITASLGIIDGSDTYEGIDINLTNADHAGTGNTLTGLDIAGITADGQASEYAISIGSGWDRIFSADWSAGTHRAAAMPISVTSTLANTTGTNWVQGPTISPVQNADGAGGTHQLYALGINAASTSAGTLAGTEEQYGLYVSNQGLASTENAYGLYVASQSGATNNYAAIFAGGNVGIGDTSPASLLTVGDGDDFQVGSTGNVSTTGTLAIGASGTALLQHLSGTATWDPASLTNNTSTNTTVTLTGVTTSDVCYAGHAQIGANKVVLSAHPSAANTVYVTLLNLSGATLDV